MRLLTIMRCSQSTTSGAAASPALVKNCSVDTVVAVILLVIGAVVAAVLVGLRRRP